MSASHERDPFPGNIRQLMGIYRIYPVNSLLPEGEIIQKLCELKPDVIYSYPSILIHIGKALTPESKSKIDPKMIISGGECLTAFRKSQIEKSFGKRVCAIYGAQEFHRLAWECPDGGHYHVCDDNVILEVLRQGKPAAVGERGEVVVTGLHSYGMPFIRYRLGDIATRGPDTCSCGLPFSTLQDIQGRMHDYFILPDGRAMHPDRIVVPIMEHESAWFDRYQLVQERTELITLRVKPLQTPSREQLSNVKTLAENRLPENMKFRVEIVDNISTDPGGKFRFCRSMIDSGEEIVPQDT
jgi:phenylacetate-CoA ligase